MTDEWGVNEYGEHVHYDEYGEEYVLDEQGNRRPPMHTTKVIPSPSGFTTYDTSQGHCGLCGKLGCNGRCFK